MAADVLAPRITGRIQQTVDSVVYPLRVGGNIRRDCEASACHGFVEGNVVAVRERGRDKHVGLRQQLSQARVIDVSVECNPRAHAGTLNLHLKIVS